jgi:hypothetical protein
MDFDKIMAFFFNFEISILSRLLFYYQKVGKVEHAILPTALV